MSKLRVSGALVVLSLALAGGFAAGRATADQPQMQQALTDLRSARKHLQNASQDKGGHRNNALEHVNTAISEVEKGVAYDRRN